MQRAVADGDGGQVGVTRLIEHGSQRRDRRIQRIVSVFLPAVQADLLIEIALGVQQAHTHQWDTEIGCGFAVIAGQHTETA